MKKSIMLTFVLMACGFDSAPLPSRQTELYGVQVEEAEGSSTTPEVAVTAAFQCEEQEIVCP